MLPSDWSSIVTCYLLIDHLLADAPKLRDVAVRVGVRDSNIFGSWPVRRREGSVDVGQDRGAGTDHDLDHLCPISRQLTGDRSDLSVKEVWMLGETECPVSAVMICCAGSV